MQPKVLNMDNILDRLRGDRVKFTKIVATIGPACDSLVKLKELKNAGMDVARLNFSHGDYSYFTGVIKKVRKVSKRVPILLDTKGPEIRTGIVDKPIEIKRGQVIAFTPHKVSGSSKLIPINYKGLAKDVKKGNTILADDGKLEFKVLGKRGDHVICRVMNSGLVKSQKSMDIPGVSVSLPDITSKDVSDIKYGLKMGIDIIAASLVRSASAIKKIKKLVGKHNVMVIAKIEHPDAIKNLDSILEVSDGIMVARGDLGLNIPTEEVPVAQKKIIKKCNAAGKPVVVATQMLESMTENPRPTRAEASDVANAIYDGADGVMLSGETAGGKYPVVSVKTMAKICEISDGHYKHKMMDVDRRESIPESISIIVNEAAEEMDVTAIVAPTCSGFSARLIAKHKPRVPIIALTNNERTMRQMGITRGVFQFESIHHDLKKLTVDAIRDAEKSKLVKKNDKIILVYNTSKMLCTTNAVEIREVKEFV